MTDSYHTSTGTTAPDGTSARIDAIRARTLQFARTLGRRPRILIARSSQTDSDREMKGVCATFADTGFDVDILGVVRSARQAAGTAVENDVHVLGVVGVRAGQGMFLENIAKALESVEGQEILVTAWQWMPPGENGHEIDTDHGRLVIFHPADACLHAVERILDILETRF